ncbi:hypothetical protein BH24ACT5_BH24ACT5_06120 [soil metagenome]
MEPPRPVRRPGQDRTWTLTPRLLAFFHEHLRGGPPSAEHRAQVFVREAVRPQPDLDDHPGTWRDVDTWPPPGSRTLMWTVDEDRIDCLPVRGDVGIAAWNSCAGALPWGQPLDQRADNAASLTYEVPCQP